MKKYLFLIILLFILSACKVNNKSIELQKEYKIYVSQYIIIEISTFNECCMLTYTGMISDNIFSLKPDWYRRTSNVFYNKDIRYFSIYQRSYIFKFELIDVDREYLRIKLLEIIKE